MVAHPRRASDLFVPYMTRLFERILFCRFFSFLTAIVPPKGEESDLGIGTTGGWKSGKGQSRDRTFARKIAWSPVKSRHASRTIFSSVGPLVSLDEILTDRIVSGNAAQAQISSGLDRDVGGTQLCIVVANLFIHSCTRFLLRHRKIGTVARPRGTSDSSRSKRRGTSSASCFVVSSVS